MTVCISTSQLKTTNLIFLEHQYLLRTDSLQRKEINYYKEKDIYWTKIDSLRQEEIQQYKVAQEAYQSKVATLEKRLKVWEIGGASVSLGLLIWLLLK